MESEHEAPGRRVQELAHLADDLLVLVGVEPAELGHAAHQLRERRVHERLAVGPVVGEVREHVVAEVDLVRFRARARVRARARARARTRVRVRVRVRARVRARARAWARVGVTRCWTVRWFQLCMSSFLSALAATSCAYASFEWSSTNWHCGMYSEDDESCTSAASAAARSLASGEV